jgi:hypothetical protein
MASNQRRDLRRGFDPLFDLTFRASANRRAPISWCSRGCSVVHGAALSLYLRNIPEKGARLTYFDVSATPSPDAVMHARAVMAAVKSSGTNTPVLNGHVIKPAVLREAARVIAIASKVSSNAPASAQGSPP